MKVLRLRLAKTLAVIMVVCLGGFVCLEWIKDQEVPSIDDRPFNEALAPQVAQRGAYLVQVGNCAACHTARGGFPFAGGKGIDTSFGTVFTSNITSDKLTGIGAWSAADFWQAMHHGRSRDGRLLYPAFPYTEYTRITRDDTDAMFAYLLSVQPVQQTNRPHALKFPYNTQAALAVWRALFFSPEPFEPLKQQSDEWNRGAYLVKVQRCEMGRDFHQVLVRHVVQQISHGRVLTSTVSKVDELVVQITSGLARNPREIADICCSPILAMACGACLHPLPHGIRWFSRQDCALVKAKKKQPPC